MKQNAEIRSAFFATAQMLIIHIFNSVLPFSCRGHGVGDSRNLGKSVVRLFVSSSSESHVSGCRNDIGAESEPLSREGQNAEDKAERLMAATCHHLEDVISLLR